MDCDPTDHFQVPTPMIKLKSSDGKIFEVEVKVAKLSLHLKAMLDDLGVEENEVIGIPENALEISGTILEKIIQWANQHKDDPAAAENNEKDVKPMDDISRWDAEFLQVDQATLFQMIRAANYLNIQGLLDVACKKVANMIKRMNLEEIRQAFCIHNDFSPDEEQQVWRDLALYRWSVYHKYEEIGRSVNQKGMDKLPADSIQIMDKEIMDIGDGQDIEDCLNNSVVVRKIFQHFCDGQLLTLSFINKMWNNEARSVIKKRGNLFAHVKITDYDHESCQRDVEAFLSATRQMNIVPFSGLNIDILHFNSSGCSYEFSDPPLLNVVHEQLELKKFSLSVDLFLRDDDNCSALLLAKKVLQNCSEDLEEFSFSGLPEREDLTRLVQDCRFPRLKVLKFYPLNFINSVPVQTNSVKDMVSRAPKLQELHTNEPIDSVFSALEGSSAVIVYTALARAPFDKILEANIAAVRLETIELFYTGREFNFQRFSRVTPVLLEASTTTLRSIWVDAVLAVPLMCYGIRFERVEDFQIHMHFRCLERREPRPRILRIVKHFDFTRIFPNLNKVKICSHYSTRFSQDHMESIIERANAVLPDPTPDRAANVKELHLEHDLSDETSQFFMEMLPSIEKLKLELFSVQQIPFTVIWKYWVDLKNLEVKRPFARNTENLDSVFCGIFPEEVAELRQKDEDYLKSVNIVPVMPAITGLKNLRVLSLRKVDLSDEPYVNDGTFMFSKVTGLIAFARCPALTVRLNFVSYQEVTPALLHLKSFASVTVD